MAILRSISAHCLKYFVYMNSINSYCRCKEY